MIVTNVVSVFDQAETIEPVSTQAAAHYAAKQAEIVIREDQLLESVPNLSEILGGQPLEVMFENHRNHARFMANVFRFNHYRLMARIVVWVYRSYHARNFSFEYFRLALPRWQQAVGENLKQPEAADINRVYQWLIDHHDEFVELAQSQDYVIFSMDTAQKDLKETLLSLLLQGDFHACSAITMEIVKSPAELSVFYLQVIQPCMVEIGNRWESGAISVAQEHLVSALVQRMTSQLYTQYVMGNPSKGSAVITATGNELHDMGARFVADLLEMDGWLVVYLGANTPRQDLVHLLRAIKPDLLGMSVVMPYNLEEAELAIAEIRKDKELQKTRIMVGGPAFLFAPDLWRRMGADGIAPDGAAAVALARNWWEER